MNQTNYNIIIATDSFKGSMTSYEAGDAIATAIKEQTPSRVTVYPVADGGEQRHYRLEGRRFYLNALR